MTVIWIIVPAKLEMHDPAVFHKDTCRYRHIVRHCMSLLRHCVQSARKIWKHQLFFFFASYLATARQRDVSPQQGSTGVAAAMHTCRGSKQSTLTIAWLHSETRHKVRRQHGKSTSSSSLLSLTASGETTWTVGKQRGVKRCFLAPTLSVRAANSWWRRSAALQT